MRRLCCQADLAGKPFLFERHWTGIAQGRMEQSVIVKGNPVCENALNDDASKKSDNLLYKLDNMSLQGVTFRAKNDPGQEAYRQPETITYAVFR